MTQLPGKPGWWNEINPSSEKPKFGRGTAEGEMKPDAGTSVQINGCRFLKRKNRTWLMIVQLWEGSKALLIFKYHGKHDILKPMEET